MYHVPMCRMCGEYEVGSFKGGTDEYCSPTCEAAALAEQDAMRIDPHEYDAVGDGWGFEDCEYMQDGEPEGSHDLTDDAEALASAGWGTDEDYGG